MSSRIPGFYRLSPSGRLEALALDPSDEAVYRDVALSLQQADAMIENVITTFALPCGVGVNFLINGRDRLVPMVVEEPSVVAASSNMARLTRKSGGFTASADDALMTGQVQLMQVSDSAATVRRLEAGLPELETLASSVHPRLNARGGGLRSMEVRTVRYEEPGRPIEDMVILQFTLDCVDAMGANMVNTVAERLAPEVERITGETVGLRILSNLADQRLAHASVQIDVDHLGTPTMDGLAVAERITAAWRFAWADPYRACTHNKGVMNGIDPIALATGNDWRAIEAGVHAWCARDGQYRPMTRWELRGRTLHGSLSFPSQFGTVGGTTRVHPKVQANLRLMQVTEARDLAMIAASVGLAQNLGALRALATEGIQAGHMRLHARSIASVAGARDSEILQLTDLLCREQDFSEARARELLIVLRSA